MLMASPSETTLIVLGAAAAARSRSTAETAAFWQSVTAIGLTVTPLLAQLGRCAARRVDRRARETIPPIGAAQDRTVIFGFGRVGRMVADMLAEHDRPYLAVDSDIDAVTARARGGYAVLFGDVARRELVDQLDLGHAAAVVLTMDDPVLTARITRQLRADASRPADHRPRPRHRPCRRALPRRGERRGARDARGLAAAVRGGAGRHRRGDGPGDRLDPREAQRNCAAEIMAAGELDREPTLGRRRVRNSRRRHPRREQCARAQRLSADG